MILHDILQHLNTEHICYNFVHSMNLYMHNTKDLAAMVTQTRIEDH